MPSRRTTRVLIVEDDPGIASALALELDHGGYEARAERDAPAALLTSTEWPADLVVLDLGLPSMDAIEVCRRLRRGSSVPILVLTARDSIEDRVRGLDAGADDYLTKPFSLDELMARVRSMLRRRACETRASGSSTPDWSSTHEPGRLSTGAARSN
jgi:DNA-binding response OmpR family regulator